MVYFICLTLATVACIWAEARDRKRAVPRTYAPAYAMARSVRIRLN